MKINVWLVAAMAAVLYTCAPIRLSGQGQEQSFGKMVALPPFLVEDNVKGHLWQYASVRDPAGDLEILSNADPGAAERFAQTMLRQEKLLREFLPADLVGGWKIPAEYILVSKEYERKMARGMRDAMETQARREAVKRVMSSDDFDMLPELCREDSESSDTIIQPNDEIEGDTFVPEYVGVMLANRRPTLPAWFRAAALGLYAQADWSNADGAPRDITLPPMGRVTVTGSVETLFMSNPPALVPADQISVHEYGSWQARATLFVRWAYDGQSERRQALWQFVRAAASRPVDEALFRSCFGMGFGEMDNVLAGYGQTGADKPVFLANRKVPVEDVAFRDATSTEVARIMGDLMVKEIMLVRAEAPGNVQSYIGRAEATLLGPYSKGERDPAFLAVLGLYYHVAGQDDEAADILGQAVAEADALKLPLRPNARIVLAAIRLESALRKPEGPKGSLSPAQTAYTLAPIRRNPECAESVVDLRIVYQTLVHSSAVTAADVELLENGTTTFPLDKGLRIAIANVRQRSGRNAIVATQ
ncbi:MAG: hypothetical protein KGI79_03330 [Patescibacteria group bacterium]|nr:hypothetical protein [Patescibacteria group bacterium]MDE2116879.1 hypothetical protein [Patescibacteria group bacterium]